MSSHRSNYEVCECPNSSGQIQYACNCGSPAVFLCSACVISHLSLPRSHLFISIEQARALRNANFNQQFTDSFSRFMNLKTALQNYQEMIANFTTYVRSSKPALKSLIDQVFDSKISELEGINSYVSKKIDEISRMMLSSSQTGLEYLEKYAASGLSGVLPDYCDNLELREQDIKYEILNSIIISKSTETSKYLSYSDLVTKYNKLSEQNSELQAILQSFSYYFDQIQIDADRNPHPNRISHDVSYEESLEKYRITIENNKILYQDRLINQTIEYPIRLEDNSQISQGTCCLSPGGDIFIVSYSSQPQYNYGQQVNQAYCDTFRFNKNSFTCTKLSNLNVRRGPVGLCFNGEYLYAFGGYTNQISPSGIAERMKWASQGWVKLPDMLIPRYNCSCYSVKNFIIIHDRQNRNRLEYFDVNTLKYTLIKEFGFYTPDAIKRIDDLIYILNVSVQNNIKIAVLTDEMKLIQSNNTLRPSTLCCFGRSNSGEVETICISYSDMKLKLHDIYDSNYKVIKEVKIALIQ